MDRILIVDDEFLIRYTLEEGLKDRGYDAYSAATVEEGLEFVRKYHPGVLLLDNLLENSVGRMRLSISKMQMRNCRSS